MSIRVCILGEANPFTWHKHYVQAFRRQCDVLTIGPNPGQDAFQEWGLAHLADAVVRNDIEVDLDTVDDLYTVLPDGWTPHLVVSIPGGNSLTFTETASLACPTVYLSIDTWQAFTEYSESLHYDLVFAAQRAFVPYLRATGSRHVHWLPLACDPEVHHPANVPQTYDISFAGAASRPVHRERARLLYRLSEYFSVCARERVHNEDYCRLMCSGRLAFNHSAVEDLNMRVFEALAMECTLLTNRASAFNGLLDLFEDGEHLVVYDSEEDLIAKAGRYLADESARRAIARRGREAVLARHTYDHRVSEILETVRRYFPEFDKRAAAPAYPGDSLASHLPKLPGIVMDFGMGLDASRYALRRRGVSRFVGLASSHERRARRRGSYDEVYADEPAGWRGKVDTVVLSDPTQWDTMDAAVRLAHSLLCEGGTLVARIPADRILAESIGPDAEQAMRWFHTRDFHVTRLQQCAGGQTVITGRKRIRKLRDVVIETFTNLNVPEIDIRLLAATISPDC